MLTLFLVATSETTYTYLVGVDRENATLLCDPMDNGSINTLRWFIEGKAEYLNPMNIHSERNILSEGPNTVICQRNGTEILRSYLIVKGKILVGI